MKISDYQLIMKITLVFLLTILVFYVSAQQKYNVKDFGASGDGKTLDTEVIQKAIDQCYSDNGGVVFLSPGIYVSGTLQLKSHVTLEIGKGAILRGSVDLLNYHLQPDTSYTRGTASRYVFIQCVNMHDVSIIGEGIIDGLRLEDPGMGKHGRGPLGVLFENSDNILVSGITIRDAAGWSLTFFGCKGVVARDVKVLNGRADGINPVSSSDVLLDACLIEGSGDDAITIKNEGSPARGHVVENVIIRNCVIRNAINPAVKIGTGTAGIFRNILVTGCIFENTGAVFTLQLMRPSLNINPERVIENVTMTDIISRNSGRFLDITTIGVDQPVIRNIYIHDIVVDGVKTGSRILGTEEAPISNICIDKVFCQTKSKENNTWLKTDFVDGLTIRNIEVRDAGNMEPVLDFNNGSGLRVENIDIPGDLNNAPLFRLTQAKNVKIKTVREDCQSPEISIEGSRSDNILFFNDSPQCSQAAIVSSEVPAGSIRSEADKIEVLAITLPDQIKAGIPGTLKVKLHNSGIGGMYKLQAKEGKHEIGSHWLWLNDGATGEFFLNLNPVYQPGIHKIGIANVTKMVEVFQTPANIVVRDTMKVTNVSKDIIKVTLYLQNTGGEKGTKTLSLTQGGKIVDEQTVELEPGERRYASLTSKKITDRISELKVEGFPVWSYLTAFTEKSNFYFTKDGHIIIDAGGRLGIHEDYGAVYVNDVKGDFDAIVKFDDQQATGEYAGMGLIVRNELTDTTSNGFTEYTKTLKYGGFYVWRKDMDGDGKFDQNSYERGKDWFKLSKRGKTFSLFKSNDGKNWEKTEMDYTINSINKIQDVGVFGNAYNNNKKKNRVSFEYFNVFPVVN